MAVVFTATMTTSLAGTAAGVVVDVDVEHRVAVDRVDPQAVPAHVVGVAAGQEADGVAGLVEPGAVVAADGPEPDDGVAAHRRHRTVGIGRRSLAWGAMTSDPTDRLYFRQLLAGRDIARTDPIARQMVNFVYLVGDRETGEAVVIDPAYDIAGILDVLAADGMKLTGALATHYHPDHVGGDMMGHGIQGVRELLELDAGADPRAGRRGAVGAAGHRDVGHRSGRSTRAATS